MNLQLLSLTFGRLSHAGPSMIIIIYMRTSKTLILARRGKLEAVDAMECNTSIPYLLTTKLLTKFSCTGQCIERKLLYRATKQSQHPPTSPPHACSDSTTSDLVLHWHVVKTNRIKPFSRLHLQEWGDNPHLHHPLHLDNDRASSLIVKYNIQ